MGWIRTWWGRGGWWSNKFAVGQCFFLGATPCSAFPTPPDAPRVIELLTHASPRGSKPTPAETPAAVSRNSHPPPLRIRRRDAGFFDPPLRCAISVLAPPPLPPSPISACSQPPSVSLRLSPPTYALLPFLSATCHSSSHTAKCGFPTHVRRRASSRRPKTVATLYRETSPHRRNMAQPVHAPGPPHTPQKSVQLLYGLRL